MAGTAASASAATLSLPQAPPGRALSAQDAAGRQYLVPIHSLIPNVHTVSSSLSAATTTAGVTSNISDAHDENDGLATARW